MTEMTDRLDEMLGDLGPVITRVRLEDEENWAEVTKNIPLLQFDKNWNVKITPPWGGAMVRFVVEYKGYWVSVYLDSLNRLGFYEGPYWEIYPYGDDTYRVDISNGKGLMKAISDSLEMQVLDKDIDAYDEENIPKQENIAPNRRSIGPTADFLDD